VEDERRDKDHKNVVEKHEAEEKGSDLCGIGIGLTLYIYLHIYIFIYVYIYIYMSI